MLPYASHTLSVFFNSSADLPPPPANTSTQLKERDEVDSEIESCVGSLFERISTLEQDNQQLRQQLSSMGLLSDGGAVKSLAAVGTGNSDDAL